MMDKSKGSPCIWIGIYLGTPFAPRYTYKIMVLVALVKKKIFIKHFISWILSSRFWR